MTYMKTIFSLCAAMLIFGQSCATNKKQSVNRPSSKVVYSLITKDKVGLESNFSDDLKKSLSGEMLIKAFNSVEKYKDDMQAIEFMNSRGKEDSYVIRMKHGEAPIRFRFNEKNQLDKVWINDVALMK